MRSAVDIKKLRTLMVELGRRATGAGRVYLVGGSSALLLDVRSQTIDVDLKLSPEPAGIFEAIAAIKNELDINIELAAPDDFIPAIPGWQDRSEFIARYGQIDFFHYDFYGQALAKIQRGNETDLNDVRALVDLGKIEPMQVLAYFELIAPDLIRYPAIAPDVFRDQVAAFMAGDTP